MFSIGVFIITHLLRMLWLIMPWWQSNTLSSHTSWRCHYWSHSSDDPSIVNADQLKMFWQSINSHGIIVEYSHLDPHVIVIHFVCSKMYFTFEMLQMLQCCNASNVKPGNMIMEGGSERECHLSSPMRVDHEVWDHHHLHHVQLLWLPTRLHQCNN
jgi:hypothetical protein